MFEMPAIPGVPQPFPYQGSKRIIAAQVLKHLPSPAGRLLEPFAGSAAITLAAASTKLAKKFVLNDSNQAVISLWKAIVDEPELLARRYRALWMRQQKDPAQFYNEVRARFNASHAPADFLYLLARCVKAAIRYNSSGEFNNSPDHRRLGMRPQTMKDNLVACSGLLKGRVNLCSKNYLDILTKATPDDVVYMDPPYQGVCLARDNRYRDQLQFDEFVDALKHLHKRGIPFVLSYDGRTGDKSYGRPLPHDLRLTHVEIPAGRSTQATLLGRNESTFESLFVSEKARELCEKKPHLERQLALSIA
jgi:DNA adenine methylase